jgi:hypothetical protein
MPTTIKSATILAATIAAVCVLNAQDANPLSTEAKQAYDGVTDATAVQMDRASLPG